MFLELTYFGLDSLGRTTGPLVGSLLLDGKQQGQSSNRRHVLHVRIASPGRGRIDDFGEIKCITRRTSRHCTAGGIAKVERMGRTWASRRSWARRRGRVDGN